MSCTATTYCSTITAFIDCVPKLYQGEDYYLEIQLFDEEGKPLDLTEYSGILMHLYTDGFSYGNYVWPDNGIYEPVIIIQSEDTSGPIDIGIIAFNISSELSRKFLTGPVYAELKFKKNSETTNDKPTYKTIGCLKIGEVKQSLTKDVTGF
jgi:hypothetical protein